jgi:hypothetical protein
MAMTLTAWDLFAVVVLNLVGTGFLGQFLLQKHRQSHEAALAKQASALEAGIRKLQAAFDRTSAVHRVQFEAEFRAFQAIWAKVITVRGYMSALRPMVGIGPNLTPDEFNQRLVERFNAFGRALDEAKDAIFQNEIFIPESVRNELYNGVLDAATAEEMSIRLHRKEDTPDWYERGAKNFDSFMTSLSRISEMVRTRLRELTILPD